MRIISQQSKAYDGSGYHYGSVWPLFTGWASVAEYRYHRTFPAYSNLRSNALLGVDGALGHFTEVLSGDYYQSFATSSPHQIWSAAMVVSPILRGMFGLGTDVEKHQITLAPHLPADWTTFAIHNVHLSGVSVDFKYRKTADTLVLETTRTGTGDCWLEFSPAFSLRTAVVSVEVNGRRLAFKMLPNQNDQHLAVRFQLSSSTNSLVIRTRNDFGLSLANELPPLGSASRGPSCPVGIVECVEKPLDAGGLWPRCAALRTGSLESNPGLLGRWRYALQDWRVGNSDAAGHGRFLRAAEGDPSFRALSWSLRHRLVGKVPIESES